AAPQAVAEAASGKNCCRSRRRLSVSRKKDSACPRMRATQRLRSAGPSDLRSAAENLSESCLAARACCRAERERLKTPAANLWASSSENFFLNSAKTGLSLF